MISSDPLTAIANGNPIIMPPSSDPNDNDSPSKYPSDVLQQNEKKYDFLVWNNECNQGEADKVYKELERQGLHGYIYERDKRAGQYKLTAMTEAIQSTANIILLLSDEALESTDFTDKMHRTITCERSASVIPIYIGMKKKERPRLLRHHVDIQYKDNEIFWVRLYSSIQKPKRTTDSPEDKIGLSKGHPRRNPPHSSPVSRTRVPTLVPAAPRTTASRASSQSPPKSSKKTESKGFLSFLSSSRDGKKGSHKSKSLEIPMCDMRSKRKNGSPPPDSI